MSTPLESASGVSGFFEGQGFTTMLATHAGVMDSEARTVADGILYVAVAPRTGELFVYFRPYDRDQDKFRAVAQIPRSEVAFPLELIDSADISGSLVNAAVRLFNNEGVAAPFELVGPRNTMKQLVAMINDPDRVRPYKTFGGGGR